MGRERLPNRRMNITVVFPWRGREYLLSVGFHRDGRAGEVFVNGFKVGSETEALLQDACVLVSLALQSGIPASRIAAALGREGIDPAAPAASLLGGLAGLVAEIEAVSGPCVADHFRHQR